MTTIFEALRLDHEVQRTMIDDLVDTEGDSDTRDELFGQLRCELSAHALSEERHFYVPLMTEDLTQEKARHSVAEHKELDDLVERLDSYERTAPQWKQTAEELRHRLVHHLDEEEHEVFQMAGKVLSEEDKTHLARLYRREMEEARAEDGE